MAYNFPHSSAMLRRVNTVVFGILSPEETVHIPFFTLEITFEMSLLSILSPD
jgi:hypothetical protein